MANDYANKADSSKDYKVDGRVTVSQPYKPNSYNILNGPTLTPVSGVRINDTTYPVSGA